MTRTYTHDIDGGLWFVYDIRFTDTDDENSASIINMVNMDDGEDTLTWYPWLETIGKAIEAHGYIETTQSIRARHTD